MFLLLYTDPPVFILTMAMIVVAIAVHEFAHAYAADKLGDPTPRLQGRLTLSPIAHLDPIGTLLIIFTGFGWGRPVLFDPYNLKNPIRDAAIIAIAGPASNFLLASFAALMLIVFSDLGIIAAVLKNFILLNLGLGLFNLIPVAPLDGFKIVAGLLPKEQVKSWYELEQYGIFFLIALILPLFNGVAPIDIIIRPALLFLYNVLV